MSKNKYFCPICDLEWKRRKRKDIILSIIIVIVGIIIMIALTAFACFNPLMVEKFQAFTEKVSGPHLMNSFNSVSKDWQSDKYVESVSNLCSLKQTDEEKILCARDVFVIFYNYGTNHSFNILGTPEEILSYQGVCRDAATFYAAVYKNLGFNVTFIHEPQHVYIEVQTKEKNWTVDQDYVA